MRFEIGDRVFITGPTKGSSQVALSNFGAMSKLIGATGVIVYVVLSGSSFHVRLDNPELLKLLTNVELNIVLANDNNPVICLYDEIGLDTSPIIE